MKLAFVEINVLPPQPAQFAAAQPGENCRQQQRSALAGRGVNNLPDFVGGRDIRPAVAADVFSVWNATGPALGNAVHRADAHEIKRRAARILVLPQAQG